MAKYAHFTESGDLFQYLVVKNNIKLSVSLLLKNYKANWH